MFEASVYDMTGGRPVPPPAQPLVVEEPPDEPLSAPPPPFVPQAQKQHRQQRQQQSEDPCSRDDAATKRRRSLLSSKKRASSLRRFLGFGKKNKNKNRKQQEQQQQQPNEQPLIVIPDDEEEDDDDGEEDCEDTDATSTSIAPAVVRSEGHFSAEGAETCVAVAGSSPFHCSESRRFIAARNSDDCYDSGAAAAAANREVVITTETLEPHLVRDRGTHDDSTAARLSAARLGFGDGRVASAGTEDSTSTGGGGGTLICGPNDGECEDDDGRAGGEDFQDDGNSSDSPRIGTVAPPTPETDHPDADWEVVPTSPPLPPRADDDVGDEENDNADDNDDDDGFVAIPSNVLHDAGEGSRVAGAFCAAAAAAYVVVGPYLGVVAGLATAYCAAVNTDRTGDAARAVGDAAVQAKDRAVKFNERYDVTHRSRVAANTVIRSVSETTREYVRPTLTTLLVELKRHLLPTELQQEERPGEYYCLDYYSEDGRGSTQQAAAVFPPAVEMHDMSSHTHNRASL